jgi:hypothetical protein
MFIHGGTKVETRRLGYAADFCPICRDVRGFRIFRIGMAAQLYGVALGGGKLLGHERTCLRCGVSMRSERALYRELSATPPGPDVEPLVAATFPGLREHYAERLSIEEQIARRPGPLPPETRSTLLREPFQLVAPAVERRFAETHVDLRATVALLLGLFASAAVYVLLGSLLPEAVDLRKGAAWIAAGAGAAAATRYGLQAGGRFMREAIYPTLSLALRPLDPTLEEVRCVLSELTRQGAELGRKARAEELLATLRPRNRLIS